jgi:hypothetical protein
VPASPSLYCCTSVLEGACQHSDKEGMSTHICVVAVEAVPELEPVSVAVVEPHAALGQVEEARQQLQADAS